MDKTELVRLKREALKASAAHEAMSAANIFGKTTEELVEIDLAFEKSKIAAHRAWQAYDNALKQATAEGE